jgi:hypothetical protein
MARDDKGLGGFLLDAGTRFVSRAAEKVLTDPRGQEAVARAVGMAQRGRRRVEELQQRLMQAAGIPGREDYQELAKQLARIKRKARELADKMEAAKQVSKEPASPPASSGNGHPRE